MKRDRERELFYLMVVHWVEQMVDEKVGKLVVLKAALMDVKLVVVKVDWMAVWRVVWWVEN